MLVTHVSARGNRAWTLERAITLADRELRTAHNTSTYGQGPPETVPPAGGLDLALDIRSMTVTQVMHRIAERLGIEDDPRPERLGALRVPLSAVLVGIDQATDPDALLGLLDRLARQGARLLLVFRQRGARLDQAGETFVQVAVHSGAAPQR
ncbi:hypothetical protein ACGFYV_20520 [Streptomyces sp. NPDC048297]|uniref:hypothetical protein n=1 Tax=Streptomyces sp. NPDC048297 TaxID=3365531 RepID=UPI003720E2F5